MDIPSSSEEGKDWIGKTLSKLKRFNPQRIIDIGCGAGTYYNYYHSTLGGHWTGVEVWEPYVDEYKLGEKYDRVVIGDASKIDYASLGEFDIAFVGDVLEHMSKDDAVIVINELSKICKFIFISIPIVYYPSDEYDFNPHLRHIKPDWTHKEVTETFNNIASYGTGKIIGTYLLTTENIKQMSKKFNFIIGLPRSGSTLLATLLRQNSDIYVTSTSPMLDQLVANQDIYKHKLQTTKANYIQEQLDNITLRMIQGMWDHVPQSIIIDNNRGWGKNLPSVEILFKEKIKCIACYRDIPSIMASWLTLIHKNPTNGIDMDLRQRGLEISDANRMMLLWNEMVADCVDSLLCSVRDSDSILLVNYDTLCESPELIMQQVNQFIGVDTVYDFSRIGQHSIPQDDETSWGLSGMHTVRDKLEKTSGDPKIILGELYDKFAQYNIDMIAKLPVNK